MKAKIKIPYVVVLLIVQLIMSFFGNQMLMDGTAVAEVAISPTVFHLLWLGSLVSGIVKYGPMVLAVLILLAVFMEKQRRIVAEIAAVVCYVLGAAYMLLFVNDVISMMELHRFNDGDALDLLTYVVLNPVALNLFSGWVYLLVAARIQDEEITGGHGAVGSLGCILVFLTGILAVELNRSIFNVLPMILQLCYIKRLPAPFAGGGNVTTVKNIITVALVLVLYFMGPGWGIGI